MTAITIPKYNSMGNSWKIEFKKAIDTTEKETV
jgi:hypothetical protein